MFKKYSLRYYNYRLFFLILTAMTLGVLVVNSADANYSRKHIIGLIGCLCVMLFLSFVNYNWTLKFFWLAYALNFVLLLMVLIMGKEAKGAGRWIYLTDSLGIQPSEFTKIFLILFTAKMIAIFRERFNTWSFLAILAVLILVPIFLVFAQPDLSTTVLLSMIQFSIVFCAGIDYGKLLRIIIGLIPLVIAFFIIIQLPNQKLLRPYQVNRIMSFLNQDAEENADDLYQQENSVKAIGSGQLTGKGLNNDDPNSVKNAGLVPEMETDFIFCVIGEELGFVGSVLTVVLLAWIAGECLYVAVTARNLEGRLVCCGVACWVAFQSFINLGVAMHILPNTGLPLPFISYGLSSLLSLSTAMGIVLNISLQRYALDEEAVLNFNTNSSTYKF